MNSPNFFRFPIVGHDAAIEVFTDDFEEAFRQATDILGHGMVGLQEPDDRDVFEAISAMIPEGVKISIAVRDGRVTLLDDAASWESDAVSVQQALLDFGREAEQLGKPHGIDFRQFPTQWAASFFNFITDK